MTASLSLPLLSSPCRDSFPNFLPSQLSRFVIKALFRMTNLKKGEKTSFIFGSVSIIAGCGFRIRAAFSAASARFATNLLAVLLFFPSLVEN